MQRGPCLTPPLVRLTDAAYELAVAGLVQGASRPWALDLRDNNFQARDVVLKAIRGSTALTSLNKLSLTDDSDSQLKISLQRDRHDSDFVFTELRSQFRGAECAALFSHPEAQKIALSTDSDSASRATGCVALLSRRKALSVLVPSAPPTWPA